MGGDVLFVFVPNVRISIPEESTLAQGARRSTFQRDTGSLSYSHGTLENLVGPQEAEMASSGSSRSTAVDVPSPSSPPPPQARRSTRASFSNKPPSTSSHMSDPPDSAAEPNRPSLKALGKRPERQAEQNQPQQQELPASDVRTTADIVQIAPPLSKPPPKKKSKVGSHGQTEKAAPEEATKRRVLPQRNRRGGPGVGSSAIDTMILDSQQKTCKCYPIPIKSSIYLSDAHFSFVHIQKSTTSSSFPRTPSSSLLPTIA